MSTSISKLNNPNLIKERNLLNGLIILLIIIFILGLSLVQTLTFLPPYNRIIGFLLVGMTVVAYRHSFILPKEIVIYGFFLLWGIITGVIVAENSALLWGKVRTLVQMYLLMIGISNFTYANRSVKHTFFIFLIVSIVISSYGFLTGDYVVLLQGEMSNRFESLMGNPNYFGATMVFGAMAVLFIWGIVKKATYRVGLASFFLLFTIAIVVSGSRKSFLALLLLVILWLWFCYHDAVFRKPWTLVLIVFTLGALWYLTDFVIENTLLGARLAVAWQEPESNLSRLSLYKESLTLFFEHPVAGVGFDNFRYFSSLGVYAHSDYAEVLSTTGAIGFVIYFSMYFFLWRRVNRIQTNTKNEEVLYFIGIIKAFLLVLFFLGIGQPNFDHILKMYLVSSIIGYSAAIDPLRRS